MRLYADEEEYRKLDIIIDTVCKVAGFPWYEFWACSKKKRKWKETEQEYIAHTKDIKKNVVVGVVSLLCWEYKVSARKAALITHRSRANIINQAKTYRGYINTVCGDFTAKVYNESKKILENLL